MDRFPGWSARYGTLDCVEVAAGIVPSLKLDDIPEPKQKTKELRLFRPSRPITLPSDWYVPPKPELGRGVLKLEVRQRGEFGKDGKPIETSTYPLERTFLAVESPPVRLPPGTLVRVSGWIKIPVDIQLTADGVLFYDDVCGEPLGVRLLSTDLHWKQFHLYRRVPASGQISVTVALTGVGVAYFDDLRIEPMVRVTTPSSYGPLAPPFARGRPSASRVQPAGGFRQR